LPPPGAVSKSEFVDCSGRNEVCVERDGRIVVEKLTGQDAEFAGQDCGQTQPLVNQEAAIAAIRAVTKRPDLELTALKTKCPTATTWYCAGDYCWIVENATNRILNKEKAARPSQTLLSKPKNTDVPTTPVPSVSPSGQPSAWQTYTFTVTLKQKKTGLSFSYPQAWYLEPHQDGYLVILQNVDPSNDSGAMPEGFVKLSFAVDPKGRADVLQGESIAINGIPWRREIRSGEIAGDRSMTLETVHDGTVYRVYAYIAGTGGSGPLFESQVATVDQIIGSFKFTSQ
jgi:hypothetical protein